MLENVNLGHIKQIASLIVSLLGLNVHGVHVLLAGKTQMPLHSLASVNVVTLHQCLIVHYAVHCGTT